MFRGTCPKCEKPLFDVPSFDAFSESRPVTLTCQHDQTVYVVTHDKTDIYFREKGSPATEKIKAEKYG